MSLSEPMANCLVINDWAGDLDQSQWFNLALQFFFEMGSEPDVCEVGDQEGRTRKLKPKAVEGRLSKGVRFSGISLFSTHPPHNDMRKWVTFAGFNITGSRKKVLVFMSDARGLDLEVGLLADLVYRTSFLVKLTYGYGFQRAFSKGPDFFAYDLSYGQNNIQSDEGVEYKQMAMWHAERLDMVAQKKIAPFRHLRGMQRDVFPFNVLTEIHLLQKIEGDTLDRWICNSKARGSLYQIVNGVWSWVVPVEALSDVQHRLQSAGLLICRP